MSLFFFFYKRNSCDLARGKGRGGVAGFTDTIKKVFNLQYVASEPTSAKLTFRVTSFSREDFLLDSVGSFHPLLEIQCGEGGGRCCRDTQKSTVMCLGIRASLDLGSCKYLIYKSFIVIDVRLSRQWVGVEEEASSAEMAATRTWALVSASHFHVPQ